VRFVTWLLANAVALAVALWLVPGIHLSGPTHGMAEVRHKIVPLLVVALVLGTVSAFVKPLLTILSLPFIILTLGLFLLVVNAAMLLGTATKKKTTFTWSWSTDGKTWSAGVTTGYAEVDVPSLPPATYQFRVFATVGKVPGEPCQPVNLTIH